MFNKELIQKLVNLLQDQGFTFQEEVSQICHSYKVIEMGENGVEIYIYDFGTAILFPFYDEVYEGEKYYFGNEVLDLVKSYGFEPQFPDDLFNENRYFFLIDDEFASEIVNIIRGMIQ